MKGSLPKALLNMMNKPAKRPYSMKTALTVSYLLVCIVILSLAMSLSYILLIRISRQQQEENAIRSLAQAEAGIKARLSDVDKIWALLTMYPTVSDFLKNTESNSVRYVESARSLSSDLTKILSAYSSVSSIFIYREDNFMIGTSQNRIWLNRPSTTVYPFQETQEFASALTGKGGIHWLPCCPASQFDIVSYKLSPSSPSADTQNPASYDEDLVIPAVLPVLNLTGNTAMRAVIIINMNEKSFRSEYASLSMPGGSISILDQSGQIVSGESDLKAEGGDAISTIAGSVEKHGSFTLKMNGNMKQIVYYHIDKTDWWLVDEIPFGIFTQTISRLQMIMLVTFLISFLLIITILFIQTNHILSPIKQIASVMDHVGKGQLNTKLPPMNYTELDMLASRFNGMLVEIADLMDHNLKIQQDKHRLEIEALQAQINPHFIYNTLVTIRWMASIIDATNIMDSLTALCNILKPIYTKPGITWTIDEEIEYIRYYVEIMNVRYGGGITFEFNIQKDIRLHEILRFILQPIIENSIIHGLVDTENGHISIFANTDGESILIVVKDNGHGMPPDQIDHINACFQRMDKSAPGGGVGLFNVNLRIMLHFGQAYGLHVDSQQDEGTTTTVMLPFSKNDQIDAEADKAEPGTHFC